jgi:hypothetical protein
MITVCAVKGTRSGIDVDLVWRCKTYCTMSKASSEVELVVYLSDISPNLQASPRGMVPLSVYL